MRCGPLVLLSIAACGAHPVSAPTAPPAPAPGPPAPTLVAPGPDPDAELRDRLNLDFEDAAGDRPAVWARGVGMGGALDDGYELALDGDAHRGARALRMRGQPGAGWSAMSAALDPAPYRGRHLRVRGWVKVEGVDAGTASLWLRADGAQRSFDNMAGRGASGTAGWRELVAEIDVPAAATGLVLGTLLQGAGTAWFDDLSIEVTAIEPPRPIVVTGDVVDADGAPLDGAVVALVDGNAGDVVARATTAGGRFRLEATAGTWALSAHHPAGVGAFVEDVPLSATSAPLRLTLGRRDGVTVRGRLRVVGAAAPAPYVDVAPYSAHHGDVFALPVAPDGAFTAVLPRGDRYFAKVAAPLWGTQTSERTGDEVRFELTASIPGPPPEEVVRWLAAHSAALTTAEAGHGFADLAAVARMVGKARIVALGEATHGTREFFQLKHRLLEYLVATQGFTVFAIEANQPECRAINEYVLHGKGDAQTALAGIYFWVWNTEEVLAMIEWMRAWNADPTHRRKVSFVGFDAQYAGAAVRAVTAFVRRVAPAEADALLADLTLLDTPTPPLRTATADEQARAQAAIARLVAAFDGRRKAWARAGKDAYEVARQDLRVIEQSIAIALDPGGGFRLRDRAMADNLDWILAREPKGTRAVVWAHNGHVALELSSFVNMGSHLRARWKRDYVPFGFVFDHGAFQAMSFVDGVSDGVGEHTIGPAPAEDVSRAFTAAGHPLAIVDLRTAPAGVVADWLAAPHPTRSIGSTFVSEATMASAESLARSYDAVIFVETTTRARPLPAGLRPSKVGMTPAPAP